MSARRRLAAGVAGALILAACRPNGPDALRIGYFPNLTHAQALIGLTEGRWEDAPPPFPVEGVQFHAGPAAVEALFAGSIDAAYMGPIPAVNAFARSEGAFVIVAGAALGGAAVVASPSGRVSTERDLPTARLATPSLGNTQDVTARAYFARLGLAPRAPGGTLQLYPVKNADQISLFRKREIDAAWTVEPWVSRLIHEAGGRLVLTEGTLWANWTGTEYPTTVLVVRRALLDEAPERVRWLLARHAETTGWLQAHPDAAKRACNAALAKIVGRGLDAAVLDAAWSRLTFSVDIPEGTLEQSVRNLQDAGLWRHDEMPLTGLRRSGVEEPAAEGHL